MEHKKEYDPEADPEFDEKKDLERIRAHIQAMRAHPERIADTEVFLLIEHCNEWYRVYKEERAKLAGGG